MKDTPTRQWSSVTITIDGEEIEARWEVNLGKRWYFDWNGKHYAVRFSDHDVVYPENETDFTTNNPYA